MLNQSTLLITRKNPTNFTQSRKQPQKYALPLDRLCQFCMFEAYSLKSAMTSDCCSKQIETRRTCTKNSTEEPFLLYLHIQQTSQTFCTSQSLHSGQFPSELEILILLLEEMRH